MTFSYSRKQITDLRENSLMRVFRGVEIKIILSRW